MFQNALVEVNDSRPWTKGIGLALMGSVIALWMLCSILDYAPFPVAQFRQFLMEPPPAQPAAVQVISVQTLPVVRVRLGSNTLSQPAAIPRKIADIVDDLTSPPVQVGVVPGAVADNLPQLSVPPEVLPPPPRPAEKSKPEAALNPIIVGGDVQAAKLIAQPKPSYPPLARQARIQGAVHLEAVINKNGTIGNLRVLSGHPLLIQSALDAVAQWRYEPTLLDGRPVEVVTTIDVVFTLSQ